MSLFEFLEKHIFILPIKERKRKTIESKNTKKYCKGFRKNDKNKCRFSVRNEILNDSCYNRCALRQIKNPDQNLNIIKS
ncbi:MAG: hypothetical protein K0S30_1710 [Clostridia bacterium]|jgi:hypothetical protein|nr:hypothetical protein [Clostridia bacterium]